MSISNKHLSIVAWKRCLAELVPEDAPKIVFRSCSVGKSGTFYDLLKLIPNVQDLTWRESHSMGDGDPPADAFEVTPYLTKLSINPDGDYYTLERSPFHEMPERLQQLTLGSLTEKATVQIFQQLTHNDTVNLFTLANTNLLAPKILDAFLAFSGSNTQLCTLNFRKCVVPNDMMIPILQKSSYESIDLENCIILNSTPDEWAILLRENATLLELGIHFMNALKKSFRGFAEVALTHSSLHRFSLKGPIVNPKFSQQDLKDLLEENTTLFYLDMLTEVSHPILKRNRIRSRSLRFYTGPPP